MVHYVIDPSVLLHWGVKGMKWGVQKDRPPPSTEVANPKPSTTSRLNAFLHKPKNPKGDTPQDRQDSWGRSELKTRNSKFHRMVSDPRLMSDAELKARINRMKLEKQYKALVADDHAQATKLLKAGSSFVSDVLKNVATSAATDYVSGKMKNAGGRRSSSADATMNFTYEIVKNSIEGKRRRAIGR